MTYTGARGRIDVNEARRLDPKRYAIQEKRDGIYAEVHLDSSGRVERILSRNGKSIAGIAGDLLGIRCGAPDSVVCGEMDAHTEVGNKESSRRGWVNIHLFDCVRSRGRSLVGEPYHGRRDELWRMQSELACDTSSLSVRSDCSGRYHDDLGRYIPRPAPRDWRRFPILRSMHPRCAGEMWERARVGDIEGFVVVSLAAPVARRNAKRKCKPTDSLDCVVLSSDGKAANVRTFGIREFRTPAYRLALVPGTVVEVAYNGFYSDGTPRFPRIKRERKDLSANLPGNNYPS